MGKRARAAHRAAAEAETASSRRSSSAALHERDEAIDKRLEAINSQRRYSQARVTRLPKGSSRRQLQDAEEAEEMRDEVDAFMLQRDRIAISNKRDDQEEEEDDDDDAADDDNVLDLPDEEKMEEGDDDEEEEGEEGAEDEDDAAAFAPLSLDGVVGESEQERHERSVAEEQRLSTAWGSNRRLYYSADTVDYALDSDQEAAMEEEQEARSIISKTLAERTADDYTLGELLAVRAQHGKTAEHQQPEQPASQRRTGKAGRELGSLLAELEDDDAAEDGKAVDVEEVERLAGLSEAERLQLLLTRSPELPGLLRDVQDSLQRVAALRRQVNASKRHKHSRGGARGDWMRKTEIALLVYCSTAMLFLAMKAEDRRISQHPVNQQILEAREQLDRLLALQPHFLAASQLTAAAAVRKTQRSDVQQQEEKEEVGLDGTEEKDHDDDDDDDGDAEAEDAEDGDSADEERKEAEVAVLRKKKPAVVEDIFSSLAPPPVRPAASSFPAPSSASLLDELDDVGDTPAPSFPPLKKAKLQHALAAAAPPASRQQQGDEADEQDDVDDAVRLYAQLQRSQRKKKQARASASASAPPVAPSDVITSLHPELVDGKRRIGRLIERNEGLKPSRPRDRKTPKTRNRARYEKAVIKRRSQVRQYAGTGGVYGGEATGIKRNVTKSVRLRG